MKRILIVLLVLFSFSTIQAQTYKNAAAEAFKTEISKDTVQLVDVRTPGEYTQGHIKGAVNINLKQAEFLAQVEKTIDKKKTVYVYCRSGGRSAYASKMLSQAGFTVVNLSGGILGWQRAQYPIEK
jgi:rhodanese-related sulfurtransferase